MLFTALLMTTAVLTAAAAPPPGYHLIWSDEFHEGIGNQPAAKDWNWETGDNGHANNEIETYVNDVAHSQIVADPDATDGQALQILSTQEGYQSVRMNTGGKHDFQYGFVEARIKIPYGNGIWPAFWMLGSNIGDVGWPACGEIDIMETVGTKGWMNRNQSSLHGKGGGTASYPTYSIQGSYYLPAGQVYKAQYHLFQMLWQKDCVSFYVDGHLYMTRTPADTGGKPWPFNAPEFFILNTAIGGGWAGNPDSTTVWPQKMLVDYVRVYQGTPTMAKAPANVATQPPDVPGAIALTWEDSLGATSYNIYRGTARGAEGAEPYKTGVDSAHFVDTGLHQTVPYFYRVASVDAAGESGLSREVSGTPISAVESPYHGVPATIPGVLHACDFDKGAEGLGYHSITGINNGGAYRPHEGISIEAATDEGESGFDIGWAAPGQWLNYTVDIATAGKYSIAIRAASGANGGSFHLEDESGANLTGTITASATGGWQKWTTVDATATLPAGRHILKFVEDTGGYNVNTLTFTLRTP